MNKGIFFNDLKKYFVIKIAQAVVKRVEVD